MERIAAVPYNKETAINESDDRVISSRLATGILLIEGFVSVSVQMIVLRQLVPVVGYSINVTSVVITFFLAALALGYRSGGRVRRGRASRIGFNLIAAA